MIESKKEFVVLDNNLSNASTKRSPFHLLSSIFGKKKSNSLDTEDKSSKENEPSTTDESSLLGKQSNLEPGPRRCSTVPSALDDNSKKRIGDPIFLSPVSTERKKNLKIDLETLHLSRQDNPYLKRLESYNLTDETILSCTDFNSLAEKALLRSEWQLDAEREIDIHQHLVRSPPPNFPQNITHFIYSQANSPKKQLSQAASEDNENQELEKNRKSKSLNPVQTKKVTGVLDPGIREVLEYQKSQLIAGVQHSLNVGQAKFGTAPVYYVPTASNTCQKSQARWTQDSGSRYISTEAIPQVTSSLPGLSCSYLELDRKTPLGPIKMGRTLSDSICQDNKHWKNDQKQ